MATSVFTSSHYLQLNIFQLSGSTASWKGWSTETLIGNVIDFDDDGDLDVGDDYYFGPSFEYTGYTVEVNGNTYGIFASGATGYIPYDVAVDDLGAQTIPSSTTDQLDGGTPANFCFAVGTGIATPAGETAVEDLQIGDTILTADGSAVAVKWIGHQTERPVIGLMNQGLEPVRICAGALGQGLPLADLTVTADHGMITDDLVVNASALVNGSTINFVPVSELGKAFTYYHIETQDHDVILANGAAAETFVDVAGRSGFDNHQEYIDLYGAERIIPEMDRPRVSARRLLPETIRARLGISDEVWESLDGALSA